MKDKRNCLIKIILIKDIGELTVSNCRPLGCDSFLDYHSELLNYEMYSNHLNPLFNANFIILVYHIHN